MQKGLLSSQCMCGLMNLCSNVIEERTCRVLCSSTSSHIRRAESLKHIGQNSGLTCISTTSIMRFTKRSVGYLKADQNIKSKAVIKIKAVWFV